MAIRTPTLVWLADFGVDELEEFLAERQDPQTRPLFRGIKEQFGNSPVAIEFD